MWKTGALEETGEVKRSGDRERENCQQRSGESRLRKAEKRSRIRERPAETLGVGVGSRRARRCLETSRRDAET